MTTTHTVVAVICLCIALWCDVDLFTEARKKKEMKSTRNDTVNRMRNKEEKREFYLKTNPENFRVFYSYKEVMEILTKKQYENLTEIQNLLADYEKYINPRRRRPKTDWMYEGLNQSLINLKSPTKREYPCILVEGMQRNLRRKMARMLSKDMGATYFRTIPRLMKKYHRKFMKWIDLKRAVVALGFYVLSHELVPALEDSAIVMSGYWINQAAWYIARKYMEPPPIGSPVYKFPSDLVQPDIIFFFNSERIIMKEDPELLGVYDRLATAYTRIQGPEIIVLNDSYSRMGKGEIESMRAMIRERLQPRYEHLIL